MRTKPEVIFSTAEVARLAGVTEITLRQYEPEGFGSPGHWRMAGGSVVYTAAGVRLLAQAIAMAGNEDGGSALLVAVAKEEAARELAEPLPSGIAHFPWQDRKDLQ